MYNAPDGDQYRYAYLIDINGGLNYVTAHYAICQVTVTISYNSPNLILLGAQSANREY